ncbi:MAG: hypothetical protein JXR64_05500 [Spirochaetales bacterium]|nr:hypothetical protein [Spirochaetales bacterium]
MITTCRRCNEIPGDVTYEEVIEFINNLDPMIKTDQLIYEKRLKNCEKCEKLSNGMCSFCGCFVLVRAAVKEMNCPYPYNNKWD